MESVAEGVAKAAELHPELAADHAAAAKKRRTPAQRAARTDEPDPAGAFLRRRREELGRTHRSVAKAAPVPVATLSSVENGSVPSWRTFSASELSVSVEEMEAAGLW